MVFFFTGGGVVAKRRQEARVLHNLLQELFPVNTGPAPRHGRVDPQLHFTHKLIDARRDNLVHTPTKGVFVVEIGRRGAKMDYDGAREIEGDSRVQKNRVSFADRRTLIRCMLSGDRRSGSAPLWYAIWHEGG